MIEDGDEEDSRLVSELSDKIRLEKMVRQPLYAHSTMWSSTCLRFNLCTYIIMSPSLKNAPIGISLSM